MNRIIFLLVFGFATQSMAQTVFLETFDEGDAAMAGSDDIGGIGWTSACPACLSGDHFEITTGALEGLDTNGPATWETGIINIASCDKFNISFDIIDVGDMEPCGDGCNATDWVALEYNIDGTGWVSPTNSYFCAGPCADLNVIQSDDILGDALLYTTGCIEGGSTLQIRISLQTWAGTEAWRIDNVSVDCDPGPSVGAGVDQVICDGTAITLTASNPDGAVISWDMGVVNGISFTPPSGTSTTYTVTATLGDCSNTDEVIITSTAGATASISPAGPFTTSSGTSALVGSPSGGTWSSDCGACLSAGGVFNPAIAGPGTWNICYTVGVPPCDDMACIAIVVSSSSGCGLGYTMSSSDPTCYTFTDGSVTINTTGGVLPILYEITNESGTIINISNSNTANSLGEGWYYFYVEDDAGCIVIDSIFITEPEKMAVDISIIDPLCYGVPTGLVVADTVYNYNGSYTNIGYYWSPNPSGVNGVGEDSLINVGEGDYTLLINDENGCDETVDFTITYPPALYFSQFDYEPAYCRLFGYQSGNGIVFAAAGGGTPDYTYLWTNESTGVTTNNTTWGGLNPADYTMTITDDNGCQLSQTITVDSLNPIADFIPTSAEFEGPYEGTATVNVHFVNTSQNFANPNNPNADTTFFWNFGFNDADWIISQSYFEEFDTSYSSSGIYDVCLVALNKNGCSDTMCIPLTIYDPLYFVPINIFTPDGDGINDSFSFDFKAAGVAKFTCTIVNRWGKTIYVFDGINDAWDGNDSDGQECANGVYFYTYEGEAQNGDPFSGQGTIQRVGN